MEKADSDVRRLEALTSPWSIDEIEFVWLRFMPYNGAYLVKMLPMARFKKMLETGERVGVAAAMVSLTREDHVVCLPTGFPYLKPDLNTAYFHPGEGVRRLEVMTSWVDRDAVAMPECARTKLSELDCKLRESHHVRVLIGFEVEVVLLPFVSPDGTTSRPRQPSFQHSWCNMTAADEAILPALEAIVRALQKVNIEVQQFHAEMCPGQWEFVLPPSTPLEAVDLLVRAREVITFTARQHGLRATLHPRPVPDRAGTGAHIHLSANNALQADGEASQETSEHLFGGILSHLPAICAFTLPLDASYDRVNAGISSGGQWVCWGTENKQTPLRRITDGRFEVKSVCGSANPYLAVAALLAAGLDGLERSLKLTGRDCLENPSKLSDSERKALGINTRFPLNVEDSLGVLEGDAILCNKLGTRLVSPYIKVTREMNQSLNKMGVRERQDWLLTNY